MDELRLSLLIFGTCFIVAVLAHGIWKIRKNKTQTRKERIEPQHWNDDTSDSQQDFVDDNEEERKNYDDLGLGEVRVVSSSARENETVDSVAPDDFLDDNDDLDADERAPEPVKLYGSVITNPKPHMKSGRPVNGDTPEGHDFPEPPEFLIRKDGAAEEAGSQESEENRATDEFRLDPQVVPEDESEAEEGHDSEAKPTLRKRAPARRRQEPNFGDDQMHIEFDEAQVNAAAQTPQPDEAPLGETEQEVLVLNVRAPEDTTISGAALLPLLLTLGFKFGDQDIFHRHVNSNGKGPVLFSLANMFKPGVFDIDNLETFSTQGVSLFMILPIEGDAHQVFNMMHNAARKIADEFSAQILDGRRSVLTKQGLQQYMEKIREFERRRMITRT